MDTIKKSIYTLTNEESKKLNALLALVESKPNWCYDIIIKGFRFMIVYRKLTFDYAFEATMFFSPGWGHSNSIYGDSIEEIVEAIERKIGEKLTLWKDGGKYPSNYRTNFDEYLEDK